MNVAQLKNGLSGTGKTIYVLQYLRDGSLHHTEIFKSRDEGRCYLKHCTEGYTKKDDTF